MCKNFLKSGKKAIIIIGPVIVMLILAAVIFSVYYLKNEVKAPEEIKTINSEFQKSTDTDFSKADPNMPEEVLNKLKESYNSAKKILKENQYDLNANIIKANILYQTKEYEKAIVIYEKLGELNPGDYLSFKSLGDVYYTQKEYKKAEEAYLTAIKNNPRNPNVYSQLSEIYEYHLRGDAEKIEKFYQDGIENLGSNRFNLIQSYASYLENIGEYKKSIEQWKIIFEQFPDNQPIKDKIKELETKLK